MRVAQSADQLDDAIEQAQREAGAAFGVPDVFLEKYITRARHIEVQLIGDRHGNPASWAAWTKPLSVCSGCPSQRKYSTARMSLE